MADQLERLSNALSGNYRLEREIGMGGMATVYLAHDLRHDRRVALKVLRAELAAVIGAERFLAEIKTTANLQHPHILPLHDSGTVDGTVFYVMPYVEGESLRDRLVREKQLPIDDAVRITREVAGALDYAHRHGVIHRDVKPENILLHDGSALVADFGIALAASTTGGHRMTETGMSLGTPHYMSPEQAMGERELSPRSDVYALGCVLYEMLVGEPPFTGPTPQAIVAKVITEKAPFATTIRASVPRHVARAIQKSLSKLPADRFATAAAFVEALSRPGTLELESDAAGEPVPPASSGKVRLLLSALATIAVVATAAALWLWRRPAPSPAVVRVQIIPPAETGTLLGPDFVLSPDGTRFVYRTGSYGTRLAMRRLDRLEPEELPGTEAAMSAFFSPDGASLGMLVNLSKLAILPLGGAAPVQIADSVWDAGAWLDDGTIVYTHRATSGLMAVSSQGGAPKILTRPDSGRGELGHGAPEPLPGGRGVIFTLFRNRQQDSDVGVYSFATGKYKVLVRGLKGWYAPTGHLLFVRSDGALLAAPFDLGRLELSAAPTAVLAASGPTGFGEIEVSLSANGTLLFSPRTRGGLDVVAVSRDGVERRLTDESRAFDDIAVAPDGKRVVMCIDGDVWMLDIAARALSRLTFLGSCNYPGWTPDGRRVTFVAYKDGHGRLYWTPADGSTEPDSLMTTTDDPLGRTWLSSGRGFLYAAVTAGGKRDIGVFEPGPPQVRRPLLSTPFDEKAPTLSPDGRWFAYASDESGRMEIFVRPFPGPGGKFQVSMEGGTEPVWGHTGREIFYRTEQGLVAAEVRTTPAFTVSARKVLFPIRRYESSANNREYDVMPDDQSFVFFRQSGGGELNLVLNWFEELKQKVGKR